MEDQKNKIIASVVEDATARLAEKDADKENVEMKYWDGKVFLSADNLVTCLRLNAKRKTLSKMEVASILRVVKLIEGYKQIALENIPDANPKSFFTDEKIRYKGGQGPGEKPELVVGNIYTVQRLCNAKFYNSEEEKERAVWRPAISLLEFQGETPSTQPAFEPHLFEKIEKKEQPIESAESKPPGMHAV